MKHLFALLLLAACSVHANPFLSPNPVPNKVPEPGGLALVGVALLAAWAFKRRK